MVRSKMKHIKKPVILLNIDSLMPQALEVVAQSGRAPALQFLMEHGTYFPDMVSSFPTMSVTIDSTLLTGTYTDRHRVPGLHWFDTRNKAFIDYGTGFRETFLIGWRNTSFNMLYRLNHEHMSNDVTTIFEDLEKEGIQSASINSFVYRGNTHRKLKAPITTSPLIPFKHRAWTASTPPLFSLGTFSKIRPNGKPTQIATGNYTYVAKELRYLIRKGKLPAFTFCIFQDMDLKLHWKGPMHIKPILKMDREIQKILNMYPSWEDAIKENVWMVIGDNGHSTTGNSHQKNVIDLRKILKKYRIASIQKKVTKKDQLAICVNQRMAYIYLLDQQTEENLLIEQLKKDDRIDVVAWKNGENIHVASGIKDGRLTFRRGGMYTDIYDQSWSVEGEIDILDLRLTKHRFLSYGDYPDALARLYGALHSHEGRFIIVNAKPGYEFKAQLTPAHPSAAHGSLHRHETLVPLIISGTKETPNNLRLIDLKDFILRQIGL